MAVRCFGGKSAEVAWPSSYSSSPPLLVGTPAACPRSRPRWWQICDMQLQRVRLRPSALLRCHRRLFSTWLSLDRHQSIAHTGPVLHSPQEERRCCCCPRRRRSGWCRARREQCAVAVPEWLLLGHQRFMLGLLQRLRFTNAHPLQGSPRVKAQAKSPHVARRVRVAQDAIGIDWVVATGRMCVTRATPSRRMRTLPECAAGGVPAGSLVPSLSRPEFDVLALPG